MSQKEECKVLSAIEKTEEKLYNFYQPIKGITLYKRGMLKEVDTNLNPDFFDQISENNVIIEHLDIKLINPNDLKYLQYFSNKKGALKGFIIHR